MESVRLEMESVRCALESVQCDLESVLIKVEMGYIYCDAEAKGGGCDLSVADYPLMFDVFQVCLTYRENQW